VSEATQSPDGRVAVDKTIRPLVRHIANPLMLGEMGHDATHFVLGHHWRTHFSKKAAETATTISVGQLRRWIDQPHAMGLSKEAQNLVILAFAEQTNRTFLRHNVPVEGSLASLSDDLVLLEQALPSELEWEAAVARAGQIFGEAVSPLRKASTVASLSSAVKKRATDARVACMALCDRLKVRMAKLNIDPASANRMKTASATHALVDRLNCSDPSQVVTFLAMAPIATTESAMGECLANAAQLTGIIDGTNWEIFDAIGMLADYRQAQASAICATVRQAMEADEHVIALGPTLKEAQLKAVRLLTETPKPVDPSPDPGSRPTPPEAKPPQSKRRVVATESRENLTLADAKTLLANLDRDLGKGQDIKLNVSWIVEDGGDSP
jgi:hypothetical protein